MCDFLCLRKAVTRLVLAFALSLTGLLVSAVPLPPPGVQLFADPQLQSCFEELVLANGWTMTEEVTTLTCPDRNIEFLDGLQNFNNLTELDVSGNRITSAYPIGQLPQLLKLDLSGNSLDNVISLQSLHNLRQLSLSGNARLQPWDVQVIISMNVGLTHIGVAGIALGDPGWLPPLGNLQELDISETGAFTNLMPVAQYNNLRVLKAAGNQIVEAWQLGQLMQLEVLDLSDNNLVDLQPVQGLDKLRQLNLSYNRGLQPGDIQSVIQSNPDLTHIGVAGIAMGDLSWLPPAAPPVAYDLQELDISETGIASDLAPVTQYANLRVLKAAGNQIVDTWQLGQLMQLEVLDLSDNNLVYVHSLQGLNNLEQLNLSYNSGLQPVDIKSVIQNNPGLTHIGVAGIAMGDPRWLPPLGNLLELDISKTGVFPDLTPVAHHNNLRLLRAAGNQIVDAWQLDQLMQLEVLDLSDNNLVNVQSLQGLNNLRQLNLSYNRRLQPGDIQNLTQNIPGLTHIGVAGIAMGDLNWLPPQGNLLELDISETGIFSDLTPLAHNNNLRVLKAAGNGIVYAWPPGQLTQLEVLDLSDNNLADAYPLQSLDKLKQLDLSYNSKLLPGDIQLVTQNMPGLTHISVAGIAMGDLNWLPPQGNLLELDISETGVIPDLTPVAHNNNLRVLKAAGNRIVSAWPPGQLTQLEVLDLSGSNLVDAYPLWGLNKLRQLDLSYNHGLQSGDIQHVIQNNPGLTHIAVAGIAMGDLSWLPSAAPQGEYDLQELDISNTGATDLMPLAQYANLRVLKAAGNRVVSAWPLDQLMQLEVLDLSDNSLWDTYPMQWLNKLRQLDLSSNSMLLPGDIQYVIQSNPGLTHIGVAGIAMGDLNWLPLPGPLGEYNLQELDISNTGSFSDLAPVAQHANLRVLKAAGNQVLNAWPLDQLAQLEVLDLSDNKLGDVNPLQLLANLKQLNLSNNAPESFSPPIDLATLNQIILANPGLTHLGVAGVAIGDLNQLAIFNHPYSSLPYPLVELDVSNTGLADLQPVSSIPGLRVLKARSNNIVGTFGLEPSMQLQVLDLSHNNLTDIWALEGMNGLSELYLTGNSQLPGGAIQNVIQSNPALTHLGVGGIAMGGLGWLPPVGPLGEYDFVELDISSTGVLNDAYQLAQYQNLKVLNASGNAIEFIWTFDQLQRLEVLDLSDNRLIDINALTHLHNLRELDLSGNAIEFIWTFDQLQRLEVLDLSGNRLIDINALTHLRNLRELDLSGNVPVDPLAPGIDLFFVNQVIAMNPGLTHLGVGGVQLGKLDQLAVFDPIHGVNENLLELDISDTGIADFGAVTGLPGLRVLNASANQLVDAMPLVQLQQLAVIDLSHNDIRFVLPLADIVNLSLLDLRGNSNIQCAELDEMEARLLPGVLLRPLDCIVMTPPTVALMSPVDAATHYSTSPIAFTAQANDVEDGNLDASIVWSSNLGGPIGTGSPFTSNLMAGDHVITAMVTDSHGNTASTAVAITVLYNTAPALAIHSIQDGALLDAGETVVLAAGANDAEEGDLSSAIQWSSSIDGVLGTGASIQTSFSAGEHTISASVTDATGATTTDSVSVSINGLPTLSLQSPPEAGVYQQGESVSFVASASDPEDGDLNTGIQWSSNLDGALGVGAHLDSVLSVGVHLITASVNDSAGAAVAQTRTVSVNSPPQLSLLSPPGGSLFMLQESVTLSATADDSEDGDISADIQWSSDLDGYLGTGTVLNRALSLGEHTLTASITDSSGGTHAATTRIKIAQIELGVVVSGNGRKRTAALTWSGSRTLVDIYKNGLKVGTGPANGTAKYRFKDQAVFKVCETATNYCSVDVLAQ